MAVPASTTGVLTSSSASIVAVEVQVPAPSQPSPSSISTSAAPAAVAASASATATPSMAAPLISQSASTSSSVAASMSQSSPNVSPASSETSTPREGEGADKGKRLTDKDRWLKVTASAAGSASASAAAASAQGNAAVQDSKSGADKSAIKHNPNSLSSTPELVGGTGDSPPAMEGPRRISSGNDLKDKGDKTGEGAAVSASAKSIPPKSNSESDSDSENDRRKREEDLAADLGSSIYDATPNADGKRLADDSSAKRAAPPLIPPIVTAGSAPAQRKPKSGSGGSSAVPSPEESARGLASAKANPQALSTDSPKQGKDESESFNLKQELAQMKALLAKQSEESAKQTAMITALTAAQADLKANDGRQINELAELRRQVTTLQDAAKHAAEERVRENAASHTLLAEIAGEQRAFSASLRALQQLLAPGHDIDVKVAGDLARGLQNGGNPVDLALDKRWDELRRQFADSQRQVQVVEGLVRDNRVAAEQDQAKLRAELAAAEARRQVELARAREEARAEHENIGKNAYNAGIAYQLGRGNRCRGGGR